MDNSNDNLSEIMNIIGYGLAKFDMDFVKEFGCETRSAFYRYVVELGLAKTIKAVTNRQDSFDPYFDNGRRGWHQRSQRKHIKLFIDSLFGTENATGYANITKSLIHDLNPKIHFDIDVELPSIKSKFKQLQETGAKAEFFFMNNYHAVPAFAHAKLEDARLWGDGYDFQLVSDGTFMLVEVKGVKSGKGDIRMTEKEYLKAQEYKENYWLVVVSHLDTTPQINERQDPTSSLELTPKEITASSKFYYSKTLTWQPV